MTIKIQTEIRNYKEENSIELRINSSKRDDKCLVLHFYEYDDRDSFSMELKTGIMLGSEGTNRIEVYKDHYVIDGHKIVR